MLAGPRNAGAGADDGFEVMVCADFPIQVAQLALETRTEANAVGVENTARIRAPPQHRLAFGKPREDAVAIGVEQSHAVEVAAEGKQAVRLAQCSRNRRKRRVRLRAELRDP